MRRAGLTLIWAGSVVAALIVGAQAHAALLYVTNTKSETVSVIDTETFEVVQTIPLGRDRTQEPRPGQDDSARKGAARDGAPTCTEAGAWPMTMAVGE